MSVTDLLTDLAALGIRLEARDDMLQFHPRSLVTPDLAKRMRIYKVDLLKTLRCDPADADVDGTNAAAIWSATVNRLEGHPEWPADVIKALRKAEVHWLSDADIMAVRCDRCGSHDYIDVQIHQGRSVRRDCAQCGRFIDFPIWHSNQLLEKEFQA